MQQQLSYQDAGVNISEGDALVERIKPLAQKTRREGLLAGIGGFGALFEISKKYRDPVLVSGTDGVGTKLKLAFQFNQHDGVGQDLVAMSVNDILVQGAEPLFFLDYFACGKLDIDVAERVIAGIARGCQLSGCALIGGETAEMPGMYPVGEYDLAGFAVGVVEKSAIINGLSITPGDVIIGLSSSGIHSNGYSLVRKIIEQDPTVLQDSIDCAGQPTSIQSALMTPTLIYVNCVRMLMQHLTIKGMAHITGGGIVGNVPRVLPAGVDAKIDTTAWPRPALFSWLQAKGNVAESEMLGVFNCGIGFTLVVAAKDAPLALQLLEQHQQPAWSIGTIVASKQPTPSVIID